MLFSCEPVRVVKNSARRLSEMLHTRNSSAKRVDASQNPCSRSYLKPGPVSLGTAVDDSDDSDGWETDLECEECKPEFDPTGRTIYLRACEKLGITPASFFLRHMTEPTVSMMHHGLGPTGVRAMALALLYNTTITILNLRDNGIGEEGGEIMAKLLRENYYIAEMDISENHIGSQSIAEIAQTLKENYTLTKLGLAGNCLDDKDAQVLCDGLLVNSTVTHLDLSCNRFSNKACQSFAKVLDENTTLTDLDLRWNHIQVKGGETLAKGLKGNVKLKVLNLAWNGLASEGACAFAGALIENITLCEFDISHNRITDKGAFSIARGLENNTAIEIIRLAKNNIQNNGAHALINAVLKNSNSKVKKVDLTGAPVDDEFYVTVEQLKKLKEVAVVTDDNPEQKIKRHTPDPSTLLQNYIAKEHVHVVDLFRELDQDGSMQVNVKEFAKGLQKSDLSLTQFEVEKIIEILDVDKDGEIDYSEFVSIQAEWKEKEKRKTYCE